MTQGPNPLNKEEEPPTHEPRETAQRLEEKADEQEGEANRARTEDKARQAREGKRREVHFGG